jgi:hypothetical protein
MSFPVESVIDNALSASQLSSKLSLNATILPSAILKTVEKAIQHNRK